jgi:hypothetical protein
MKGKHMLENEKRRKQDQTEERKWSRHKKEKEKQK